jgi:uncharacterized protein (DUF608 family)
VKATALGGAGLALSGSPLEAIAGPFFGQEAPDHFVPADKKLSAAWVRTLFARGESTWYAGEDLGTIGMPVGGIGAGQVYLTGDGRLAYWDVFNRNQNTGFGLHNYTEGRAPEQTVVGQELADVAPVDQGFVLQVHQGDATIVRTLDRAGFPGVRFNGEYPIGRVAYADPSVPVSVALEAFSPFIPLNAADSALPATVLRYTVRNASDAPAEVTVAGWLENVLCRDTGRDFVERVLRVSEPMAGDGLTGVLFSVRERRLPPGPPARAPRVFADFEGEGYGAWEVGGTAFGSGPARGTLVNQNPVTGYEGEGLVNTYLGGDDPHGTLRSPAFTIERRWISFLIGGGRHPDRACLNLVVDGEVVRTATGEGTERLAPRNWDVADLRGRSARLEIVDEQSGDWGHVNVDQIEFRDAPRVADPGPFALWPDTGTMCLAVAGDGFARTSIPDGPASAGALAGSEGPNEKRLGERLRGAVGDTRTIQPGVEETFTFVVGWHLPNLHRSGERVGNRYAVRFDDAGAVTRYVLRDLARLTDETRLWHRTWYDATLPYWLLDRMHGTVANLATTTCQWWENGRFWAWEGGGCCPGTCGHVWNYEHALARLFPGLERSVREMQDFAAGVGFYPESGAIGFRGEGWTLWAADAQGGYVLKALREHQTSPDDAFLRRVWPAVRKATEFLIAQDADADGILEGQQHQTYDQNYYGPNTMVGSLYLGALRAAEEMARDVGERDFAATCRRIFERGRARTVDVLFDGEYFVQQVDVAEHPDWQYADGCLADQLFGQGWAHQVGLSYLYPEETVRAALASIWKYCWAPDVGPQNGAHAPERWFAYPGEAGLFTCTWPKSAHMGERSTRYRNEIWTGIEYQVAGHMAWEGMLTEALAICRGVHERYHPTRHNPWNEIECGDHYARALASWGVFTGLGGFAYHGPDRHIGFAPRITPEAFRSAFTAAEGWGSYRQARTDAEQTCALEVRWGRLPLRRWSVAVPDGALARRVRVRLDGEEVGAAHLQDGPRVTVLLPEGTVVEAGSVLEARMELDA